MECGSLLPLFRHCRRLPTHRRHRRKKSSGKPPHSKATQPSSKPVLNKQHILRRITEVAKKLGHTPSILEFTAQVEISRYSLFRLFPKWNEALRAAGLKPNRLYVRPEDNELLKDWGEAVRKKRGILSRWAYRLAGKYYPLTLAKRFGGWESVPEAFRNFAKGKREWADVFALLPDPAAKKERGWSKQISAGPNARSQAPRKPLKDTAIYGNPMNFHAMRHEPVNEQGVVLLFGMLAKELGYVVEAVQTGFPDCEAMRQVTPERWQRVRIEFEFESRNFRDHGHSSNGCDIIVCWRHNWDESPEQLEILELSNVIKSLTNSED